jgi:hypothetical protein
MDAEAHQLAYCLRTVERNHPSGCAVLNYVLPFVRKIASPKESCQFTQIGNKLNNHRACNAAPIWRVFLLLRSLALFVSMLSDMGQGGAIWGTAAMLRTTTSNIVRKCFMRCVGSITDGHFPYSFPGVFRFVTIASKWSGRGHSCFRLHFPTILCI